MACVINGMVAHSVENRPHQKAKMLQLLNLQMLDNAERCTADDQDLGNLILPDFSLLPSSLGSSSAGGKAFNCLQIS